jgi:uncharacterized cupredoxin-like copper-binding protein
VTTRGNRRVCRAAAPLATVVAAGVAAAGCSSTLTTGGRHPMMDGAYHYSRTVCSAPRTLPGQEVRVLLGDMGMTTMMGGVAPMGARMMLHAFPSRVAAGEVTFVVANRGWRTHELVVLPLGQGALAGHRAVGPNGRVSEVGSLGEAARSCGRDTGEGITSGAVGWTTIDLRAGRYELVCNLRNHYANGMYQELDVS